MLDRILKTFFYKKETKSDTLIISKREEKSLKHFTPLTVKKESLRLIDAAVKRRFA